MGTRKNGKIRTGRGLLLIKLLVIITENHSLRSTRNYSNLRGDN